MKPPLNFIIRLWILVLPISFGFAQDKATVDSLLNVLGSNPKEKAQVAVYLDLANQYIRSDSSQMMTYINKAIAIVDKIGDEESKIDATDILGMSLFIKRKFKEGEEQFKKALKDAEKESYQLGEARAYTRIGVTYLFRGQLDTAGILLTKGISQQELINDKDGLSYSYYNIGIYYVYKGNFDEALNNFHRSLEIRKELGDVDGQISAYNGIANTYGYQTMSLPALEYYFKALDLIEKGGNQSQLPNVINNIGNIYHSREEYRKALSFYERSLKLYQEKNDLLRIALSYRNMGYTTLQLGNSEEAIESLEQSVKLYSELGNRAGVASALTSLGEAYFEADQNSKSLDAYNQALALNREIGDTKATLMSLTSRGFLLVKIGKIRMAEESIVEAMPLAQSLGALDELERAYHLLSEVEREKGNFTEAYEAHIKFKNFYDSIQSQQNTRKITRLEADYEFQQERDSIAFEQAKIELEYKQEIERRNVVNQAAIGSGVLVLIILILLYRSYLIKQKRNMELRHKNEMIKSKNEELTFKNEEITALRETEKKMAEESLALKERELTNITMLSHEKNELLQQIGDQIGKIGNKVDDRIIPDLKEIKHTIKSNISDETWNSFTYHFEQVHPEFFNKLKAKYDDLSQNDLRLCAYIKVGLNNKVIAQMGNVTLAAVKKNINRLKKKMGIGPDDSLRDFMLEFV